MKDPLRKLLTWREANDECRRAAQAWAQLSEKQLAGLARELPGKEMRHLQHTVFRINALLLLYAKLRRAPHSTELGVILGVITHLLDYAYDHLQLEAQDLAAVEAVVFTQRAPDQGNELQRVLSVLAAQAWRLVPDPSSVSTRLADMLGTQRRSLAQAGQAPMSQIALRVVTSDKGHHSLCLYFAAVNPGFDRQEAAALRSFGEYMQYMDDLEDFYEDRAEGRQSPVTGIGRGVAESTRLLRAARRDLARCYGRDRARYNYRLLMVCIAVFHVAILLGALVREITMRLPLRAQASLDRAQRRLAARVPFFEMAPLAVVAGRMSR